MSNLSDTENDLCDVQDGYALSECAYSFGYSLRQKYSEFHSKAVDWFCRTLPDLIVADAPRVLSLGCGNGALDTEIVKNVLAAKAGFHFTGIDFNATDLESFRVRLTEAEGTIQSSVELKHQKFDQATRLDETYDIITMVHFLHSFDDVMPIIVNAMGHLKADGKLIIVQTGEVGVWPVKQKFLDVLPNGKFQSSERTKRELREHGVSFSDHSFYSSFDISLMKTMSLDTVLLMSFCLGNDLVKLNVDIQDSIRRAFLSSAICQDDGRLIISEAVETIICNAQT